MFSLAELSTKLIILIYFERFTKSACLVAAKAAEAPWGNLISMEKRSEEYDPDDYVDYDRSDLPQKDN